MQKEIMRHSHDRKVREKVYLSPREQAVLQLLVRDGYGNREIGEELGIKETTVRGYISGMLQGFGLSCRTQLTNLAHRNPSLVETGIAEMVIHAPECPCAVCVGMGRRAA